MSPGMKSVRMNSLYDLRNIAVNKEVFKLINYIALNNCLESGKIII